MNAVTYKETRKLIEAAGWIYKNTVGSHDHFIHPDKPGKVTIPNHRGDIPKGTYNSILKQAGLK